MWRACFPAALANMVKRLVAHAYQRNESSNAAWLSPPSCLYNGPRLIYTKPNKTHWYFFYSHFAGGIGAYTRLAVPQGSSVCYWHAALCFARKQAARTVYRDRGLWSPLRSSRGHLHKRHTCLHQHQNDHLYISSFTQIICVSIIILNGVSPETQDS